MRNNDAFSTAPDDTVSVCIFSARETLNTLADTISSSMIAAPEKSKIDVLVNGNPNLALDAAKFVSLLDLSNSSSQVRVWRIDVGDKAHAWNQHIHHIWERGASFYVDGYVRLKYDAITKLYAAMKERPNALGGTGVPSVGRSAERLKLHLLKEGGYHGNFCCISETALTAIKSRNIYLPLGLYRVDSLMGAILSFGLDPVSRKWDSFKYIAVAQDATWITDKKSYFSFNDVKSSLKRLIRQSQGDLENKAIRHHLLLKKRPPEALPETSAELVLDWINSAHDDATSALKFSPFARYALRNFKKPRDWSAAKHLPVLIGSTSNWST